MTDSRNLAGGKFQTSCSSSVICYLQIPICELRVDQDQPNPPITLTSRVILSNAQDLCSIRQEILHYVQDDVAF